MYIPFGCASGNIDPKPGMSHYIPSLIAEYHIIIYLINHVSVEALTIGRMILSGTDSDSDSDSNKNVDIKFSAYDSCLE